MIEYSLVTLGAEHLVSRITFLASFGTLLNLTGEIEPTKGSKIVGTLVLFPALAIL